jgi:hypothetical protein
MQGRKLRRILLGKAVAKRAEGIESSLGQGRF